jgi:beta-glucosidase
MGAYNRVLGEPACGSKLLLVDILRGRWGFKGHVVSDCGAIDDFHQHHRVTKDAAASAALAVRRGCDLNCGCTYHDLVVAVNDGLITPEEIDTSLRRLLATKFRLGLFDPADRVPWARTTTAIIDSPAHRQLARQAAAASIVLLKNDGVLPLRRDHDSLLVTGPTAASTTVLLGNYFGISSRLVTITEGITGRVTEGCRVAYRTGCPLSGPMAPGVNYTFAAAADSEITIAVVGLDPSLEGEEGDTVASPTGGDRDAIELPQVQRDFLVELRKHARKLIVVLTGGSAIAVPEVHEFADAMLQVWYPGCEGGEAVADVLFGDANPSGRLPVTVPRCTNDLPPFEDYAMRGRTYRFATIEPLYPFGFGLGYARFRYDAVKLTADRLTAGQGLGVQATLTNQSEHAADEIVQCYIVPPRLTDETPLATLVAFEKVNVPAHRSVDVFFQLPAECLAQVDAAGQRIHAPGRYQVVVGPASPGPRAQALGAPDPVVAELTLA